MAIVVAPEKGFTVTLWPTAFPRSFPCILEIIESPMSRVVRSFGFSGSDSFPVRVLLGPPLSFDFVLLFFDFKMKPCSLLAQGVNSSIFWTMICSFVRCVIRWTALSSCFSGYDLQCKI